ncbi:MAG: hypothetical protein ABIC91_00645 [Nanoarchaeota archaeon]|nr:hypothetical protein [Nanoarchaeota archaeon]MBU1029729.1 hypothetical protein [Nanoarchaeota archaeon]MBU1849172.1 hypothetical protein [Nanoarchaeota archaeon]
MPFELTVFDASSYQILNRMSPDLIPRKYSSCISAEIIEKIQDEFQKSFLKDNCVLRNQSLDAMMKVFGVQGKVIDAVDLYSDKKFIDCFQEAIDFCQDQNTDKLLMLRNVSNMKCRVKSLYTPLETAEAVYFFDEESIKYKLGPKTESSFDRIIQSFIREERKDNYQSIWYSTPPWRKPSYLTGNEQSIYFNDSDVNIKNKLDSDQAYNAWISDIVTPFTSDGSTVERVRQIINSVKEVM